MIAGDLVVLLEDVEVGNSFFSLEPFNSSLVCSVSDFTVRLLELFNSSLVCSVSDFTARLCFGAMIAGDLVVLLEDVEVHAEKISARQHPLTIILQVLASL
jgi:hypothetical protein